MTYKGRPVRGAIGGFLLGLFVDLDLAFGGVVKTNSVVLTILPIAGLVVFLALGWWAPLGRGAAVTPGAAPGVTPGSGAPPAPATPTGAWEPPPDVGAPPSGPPAATPPGDAPPGAPPSTTSET